MIKRIVLVIAFAGFVNAADIKLPNPGFEASEGGRAGNWGVFHFGDEGSGSRLKISKDARTGTHAIEIGLNAGDGGQGIYADVPVAGLRAGDTVSFSVHMKSKSGKPLAGGVIDLHVEFMSASGDEGEILGRTDTLGSSKAIGLTLTDKYRRYTTTHTIKNGDVPEGLGAVKALRFVIVAVQPADRVGKERLGSVIIDDASAELKR